MFLAILRDSAALCITQNVAMGTLDSCKASGACLVGI
jgi:hypothetical protein